jgi:FlaA1/EpsC-like NDP-sugar epimerase
MIKPFQQRNLKLLVLSADLLIFLISFVILFYLRINPSISEILFSPALWFGGLVAIVWMYVFGTYDLTFEQGISWLFIRITMALGISLGISFAMIYLTRAEVAGLFGRGVLIGGYVIFSLASFLMKSLISQKLEAVQDKMEWLVLGTANTFKMIEKDFKGGSIPGKMEFIDVTAFQVLYDKLQSVSGVN